MCKTYFKREREETNDEEEDLSNPSAIFAFKAVKGVEAVYIKKRIQVPLEKDKENTCMHCRGASACIIYCHTKIAV